jgi:uncharacterized membrane protein YeiB
MPGTPTDRLAVVDTLRAVALFGIIVTHADMEYLAGLPPDPGFRTFGALDATVTEAVRLLASGKFFSIFSFLFGLSFAIQLDRATRKRAAFAGRFGWRLVILFAIGMAHSAFFSGDILTIYALLGFLLLPLNRFDSKVLLPLAVALALNVPGIANGIAQHVRTAPPTASAPAPALLQAAARQFDIKQNGTAGDVVRMNLRESLVSKLRYQIVSGRLWMTLGFFLLGVCAGRANLFQDTPSNRRFFRRLLLWSAPCAAITTAIAVAYPVGLAPRNAAQLLPYAAWYVQLVSLAGAALLASQRRNVPARHGQDGSHLIPAAIRVRLVRVLRFRARAARTHRLGLERRARVRLFRAAALARALVDRALCVRAGRVALALSHVLQDAAGTAARGRHLAVICCAPHPCCGRSP